MGRWESRRVPSLGSLGLGRSRASVSAFLPLAAETLCPYPPLDKWVREAVKACSLEQSASGGLSRPQPADGGAAGPAPLLPAPPA